MLLTLDVQTSAWNRTDSIVAIVDRSDDPWQASQISKEWALQQARLREIAALSDNWDGEGAIAPSGKLIESAAIFLQSYRRRNPTSIPSRIVPMLDGGIIFEWQTPPTFATLEINEPYHGEWMIERSGYPVTFLNIDWHAEDVLSALENLPM